MDTTGAEGSLNDEQMALLVAAHELEVRHEAAPMERLAELSGLGLDATEQLVAGLDNEGYLQHGVTTDHSEAATQPPMIVAYKLTDRGRRVTRRHRLDQG